MDGIRTILCGVDGSDAGVEAARQAVALAAGAGATLRIVAVTGTLSQLLLHAPHLREDRLEESLGRAVELAIEAGVAASGEMRSARHPSNVLLPESQDHDLTVVGSHGHSRAAGIGLGKTATELAHKARRALLVARRPPSGALFPRTAVLASDGSEESWPPTRMCAWLARRFGARVVVVHVRDGGRLRGHRELEPQLGDLAAACGEPPKLVERRGLAAPTIAEVAGRELPSLLAIGHRGLWGVHALVSVSERVVHTAPCSVLVVP